MATSTKYRPSLWTAGVSAWLLVWLAAAVVFFGRGNSLRSPHADWASHSPIALEMVGATHRTTGARLTKSIEKIRVGNRVHVELPVELRQAAVGDLDQVPDWDRFDHQIDPSHWRSVSLSMEGGDGDHFEIVLLRPLTWVQDTGAYPGASIHLVIPDQGLDGPADVLAVGPCPPIKPDGGRVVTGTYTHVRSNILRLHLDDADQPLEITNNHAIYSVDQQAFVHAEDLRVGEHLQGLNRLACITQVEALPGEQRVYNLEVHAEHVFHVTAEGVLVHNASAQTGSYTITFASGKQYHGKGPATRARASAARESAANGDPVSNIDWTPAANDRAAFIAEAQRIRNAGGLNPNNYNRINSPGERMLGGGS
jgi:pretoxin HINT domain-containing protein